MKKSRKWIYVIQNSFKEKITLQIIVIFFFLFLLFYFILGIVTRIWAVTFSSLYVTIFFAAYGLITRSSLLEIFMFRKMCVQDKTIVTRLLFVKRKKNIREICKIKKKVLSVKSSFFNIFRRTKNPKIYIYSIFFESNLRSDESKENKELTRWRLWDFMASKEEDCQKIEEFIRTFWYGEIEIVYGARVVVKRKKSIEYWDTHWSLDPYGLDIISQYHRGKNLIDIMGLILSALLFLIPLTLLIVCLILYT